MRPNSNHSRSAFTLIEMLVTMMVMLIMVLAMSQMFALIGRHVTDGRAVIELQGQLRNAAYRVQEDFDGLTILARTSPNHDWQEGYFEYIEGVDFDTSDTDDTIGSDANPWWVNDTVLNPNPVEARPYYDTNNPADPLNAARTAFGDIDDVLIFTARSTGKPFVGRIQASLLDNTLPPNNTASITIESHDAEIIYWTQWSDTDGDGSVGLGEVTLHRRILLIRPDLIQFDNPNNPEFPDNMPGFATLTSADLAAFHNRNDLSVRPEARVVNGNPGVRLIPNSLADLAKRENRIAHLPNFPANNPIKSLAPGVFPLSQYFPNRLCRAWLPLHFDDDQNTPASATLGFSGSRRGQDVVLSDVLAFDVRAFDPTAQLWQGSVGGDLLAPGDAGWDSASIFVGNGAYVDLNYLVHYSPPPARPSAFSGAPATDSGLDSFGGRPLAPTYDTWTWAYEHDGLDQTNGAVVANNPRDEATDGIDNNGANGVDDPGERETSPPYPSPLRGLKVTLRAIELDTRQVRQTSVVAEFVPE